MTCGCHLVSDARTGTSARRCSLWRPNVSRKYSAFGGVAAVIAVWNSSLSVAQVSVVSQVASSGEGSPPLPWPRAA
jgi:hypothetical protein